MTLGEVGWFSLAIIHFEIKKICINIFFRRWLLYRTIKETRPNFTFTISGESQNAYNFLYMRGYRITMSSVLIEKKVKITLVFT